MKFPSHFIASAALLLAGAGCSVGISDKSSVRETPTPAAAPDSQAGASAEVSAAVGTCPYGDKILCRFLTNWTGVGAMSMRSTAVIDGKRSETLIENDGKDASRLTMTEDGKETFVSITIGQATYMKNIAGGFWLKSSATASKPGETATEEGAKIDFTIKESAEETTNYVAAGKEACGSLTCFKYEVVTKGSPVKEYIWFDDKEYRLRRMMTISADGSSNDTAVSYDGIVITAPSPVQEAPPLPDFSAGFNGLSDEDMKKLEANMKAYEGVTPIGE